MQPMKKNLNRIRIITFRVTEDEYAGIANAALAADDEPNSWCRSVALNSINKTQAPIDNRAIYTEIACLRHLFNHGFNILFSNDSNALNWLGNGKPVVLVEARRGHEQTMRLLGADVVGKIS
jgi:hypothetical protein